MKQLIPQSKIDEAAREASTINKDNYPAWEILFKQGVQFALNEIQPLVVEFAEWVYKGDHPYSHDAFCIRENRNKWHDDDGNFITTQQLLEEFINSKNK